MTAPAFGLYTATAMTPAQVVQAGHTLALNEPLGSDGVKLFRRSLWLPVPPGLAAMQALQLAASTLQCRFAPTRFVVGTESLLWFPKLEHLPGDDVRLELAWPAEVVAVSRQPGQAARELALLRADGDAVADKATVSGRTGSDLPEPFVGTPLVLRLGPSIFNLDERAIGNAGSLAFRAAPVAAGTATTSLMPTGASIMLRVASSLVPALTLAGRPTTPRLRLVAELASAETLLWQALLPGEQATVTLPAQAIGDEWGPALEQLRGLCSKPATTPLRLRLDIESDAPCQVTVLAAALALQGEIELLSEAQQLAFDGQQALPLPLALSLPAGVTATGLRLAGRVVAEAGADASAAAPPAEGRLGALLSADTTADTTAVQPLRLNQPAAVAGLALCWQPLSSEVQMQVRLHSDGGNGPGSLVLAEQTLQAGTAQAGWLTLRWPALDLQAQRLWVRLTLSAGAGLCLFDSSTAAGWLESGGATVPGALLPQGLAMTLLQARPAGQALRAIGVHLAGQTIAATLPAAPLSLDIPQLLLPLLDTHPITFTGAVRGSVTVESARLRVGL